MGEYGDMKSLYLRYISKKVIFILLCVALAFLSLGLALSIGQYSIGFIESYQILFDHIMGVVPEGREAIMKDRIIWEMRLPRAIAAVAVGSTLGVCGAAMQSALKNPLADPYTTGISSGASLGAAIALILGISIVPFLANEAALVVNAFLFSLIPAAIITLVAKYKSVTPTSMILTGIAVMYVFSATTSLLMFTANPEALAEVYIWMVGTLGKATWDNVGFLIAAAIVSIISLLIVAKRLNILVLSDTCAISMGVNAKRLRTFTLGMVALGTSVVVGFTGTIGFVGLVAPHMVRMFIGSDNRYLIPASATFGALLLIIADSISKIAGPSGLPVGVITAIIGGPLFIILLMRQRKSIWN